MASFMSTKPLGTFQIFKEAIKLPKKNIKLILHVFVIYLITSITLATITKSSTNNTVEDPSKKNDEMLKTNPGDPEDFMLMYHDILKDLIRVLSSISVLDVVVTLVINSILEIMVYCALATTHCGNYTTLKELLYKVKGNLKGTIITKFLVNLLRFGFLTLVIAVIYFFSFLSEISLLVRFLMMVAILLTTVFAFIGWFLYFETWLLLSTIVAVIEEGCYGVGALKRALNIMKGRNWKVVSVTIVYYSLDTVITKVFGFLFGGSDQGNWWSKLLMEWIGIAVEEVFAFFFYSAMVVYYNTSMNAKMV